MTNLDIIAAHNVVKYIQVVGKTEKWVAKRIGISDEVFLSFLISGQNADLVIPKLNRLFRIKEPNYFFELDIKLPKTFEELESTNTLYKRVCLADKNTFNTESPDFKETMEVLEDFMNIIFISDEAKKIG